MKDVFNTEYRARVLKHAMQNLYFTAQREYRLEILDIFKAHLAERKVSCDGFLYKGVHYNPVNQQRGMRLQLSANLCKRMRKLLREQEDIELDERGYIHSFIVNALNLSKVPADIYALLPSVIHPCIAKIIQQKHVKQWPVSLRDDQLQTFKEENAIACLKIKERMLMNVLFKVN